MRRLNWILVVLLIPVFMLMMWASDVLGTVFRPQPHPYQTFGYFSLDKGYHFDRPSLLWFDIGKLRGAPEVLLGLSSNGRAFSVLFTESSKWKENSSKVSIRKRRSLDEAVYIVKSAFEYDIKAAFVVYGMFRFSDGKLASSLIVGDLDVFAPGCDMHKTDDGILFTPLDKIEVDPFGGYGCPVAGYIPYRHISADALNYSVKIIPGSAARIRQFVFLAPSRGSFESFLDSEFPNLGFYDERSNTMKLLGIRLVVLGVAVFILGVVSLLLLTPYICLSTYRMVISRGRELYVFYAAGVPRD